jgi:hypothetical protein
MYAILLARVPVYLPYVHPNAIKLVIGESRSRIVEILRWRNNFVNPRTLEHLNNFDIFV